MNPDQNHYPNPNNPNNLLDTIILLGYNVRIECIVNITDGWEIQLQVITKRVTFCKIERHWEQDWCILYSTFLYILFNGDKT